MCLRPLPLKLICKSGIKVGNPEKENARLGHNLLPVLRVPEKDSRVLGPLLLVPL